MMKGLQSRSGRRRAAVVSAIAMVVLPVVAFVIAPGANAQPSTPGENLAGIGADASATGIQFVPLVKGVVPAGNLATGDFVQASIPYSSSTASTGPSTSTTSTPVYPGPIASNLSSALPELGFPQQVASLLADPILAEADYPPEVSAGPSGSYSPPGGSTTGAATATAQAGDGSTTGDANLSDTPLAGGLIEIGTSTANSSIDIGASSVSDTASADLANISILSGLIDIQGISSQSSSTSNGTLGTETSSLKVGSVTVAGQAAAITSKGLELLGSTNQQSALIVDAFNDALTLLQQAGITITALQPIDQVQGASATVSSGAIQIGLADSSIPSLQGNIPVTFLGLDVDLGLTEADSNATLLPPLESLPPGTTSSTVPSSVSTTPVSTGAITGPTTGGGTTEISQTNSGSPNPVLSSPPTTVEAQGRQVPTGPPRNAVEPAAFLGMPTRMAWVVIAVLLSIVASAPLLSYANWQLLRGRNP